MNTGCKDAGTVAHNEGVKVRIQELFYKRLLI